MGRAARFLRIKDERSLNGTAQPQARFCWSGVKACATIALCRVPFVADRVVMTHAALVPRRIIADPRRRTFGMDDPIRLGEQLQGLCLIDMHPFGVEVVGVFVDRQI